MLELQEKWDELKKALSHKAAIAPVSAPAMPKEEETLPHPDHVGGIKYGMKNIPGADDVSGQDNRKNMGFVQAAGKKWVARHGAAAHRTDVEHQMSKLLGADHMLPEQHYDHGVNHSEHHGQETFNPHDHAGTSFQEHHDGKHLYHEGVDKEKLREQWKNGDLHKLWALHYISNNGDMHAGNFKIGKDGIKAFDSDRAFYELPTAHVVDREDGADGKKANLKYMPYTNKHLPSYLAPFIDSGEENDEGIEPDYKDDQVSVKSLNDHAANIQPDLFENFGPHAADRAAKAKKALMSADPTTEMKKLWEDHKDATGDLLFDKMKNKDEKVQ